MLKKSIEHAEELKAKGLQLYTLAEVEAVTGIYTRTLKAYIKAGKLKGAKIGGKYRVTEENLRAFLNAGTQPIKKTAKK